MILMRNKRLYSTPTRKNYVKQFKNSVTAVLFAVCMLCGCVSSDFSSKYTFTPSSSSYEDVVTAQSQALQSNKLLLVVLGAQWCHDSTGLEKQFNTDEMQLILGAHYETVFVDVGLLEDKRQITQRFNYPTYYATPTVMIVDPASSALLNRTTMNIWGNADSIPLADYIEYFLRFPALTVKQKAPMLTWATSEEEKRYNAQQAQRLQIAYSKLGPLLADDIAGNTPEGFDDLWKETKRFRTALQKSMTKRAEKALNTSDKQKSKAQTTPALRHYHPFSWETN